MTSIASVPRLYLELMDCVKSNQASLEKVSGIIAKDMGMSAKVLQLANSALGASGRIAAVADAVAYLGLDAIRTLSLTLHAFTEFQPADPSHFCLHGLWRHSLATGALAERIIQTLPADGAGYGQMQTIGVLHDVGRLVLAANLPKAFGHACELAAKKHLPEWEAEREAFGATHAEVGAYLIGLWGLPEPIVEAVAYHHAPGTSPHSRSAILTALHVADALVTAADGSDVAWHYPEPDFTYLSEMALAGRLPEWRRMAGQTAGQEVACG